MKHQVFGRKLNRDVKERRSLFKSLVISLIEFGKIRTTLAKAKAISGLVEKLVTKAKDGNEGATRQIASFLARKDATDKLVKNVAPRFVDRIGGYIRIIRLGKRKGDGSEEVLVEWTESEKKEEKKEKPQVAQKTESPVKKKEVTKEKQVKNK